MSLGLVCQYIEEKKKKNGSVEYVNIFENKTLQLGRWQKNLYTEEVIRKIYVHNVNKVLEIMPMLVKENIKLFRLSSELIPLADRVPREWWDNNELRGRYKVLGDFCKQNQIRITMHPGQFCVLNSEREDVIQNAIGDLEHHAWVMDACEFEESPYYAINIHAGCRDRFNFLIQGVNRLRSGIRKRLTFENCETVASVEDLYSVYESTGIPIVFDSHHHTFKTGNLSMEDAFAKSCKTWGNIKPLQHIANTEPGSENGSFPDRRKHSQYLHYIPDCQLSGLKSNEIDVELEAKMKNLALHKFSLDFSIPIS